MSTPRPRLRWEPFAFGVPIVVAGVVAGKVTSSGSHSPYVFLGLLIAAALIAYTVWVVPISWTLSAGLVLTMFGGNWKSLGFPSSVAPDRIVLALAMLAIAVRAPSARDRLPLRFRPLYALMYAGGAYAIASAMAVGTASSRGAIFDLFDRMQIFQWALFIVVCTAMKSVEDRRILLGTLVGMGLYLGLTGIFEILGPRALVFPRYINNPHLGVHFGRARGPFLQAAVMGLALYACIVASAIALLRWRGTKSRRLAGVTILLCWVSLILTFQRTIWLGLAVTVPVTLLAVRPLRRLLPRVLLATAVLVGVAFAIPSVRAKIQTRVNQIGTVQERAALDDASINMVNARPLFGFGWGRFIQVAPDYFSTSDAYSVEGVAGNPVHDVYASIAAELGLIGLAAWLAVLVAGVGGAALSRGGPPDLVPWKVGLGSLFLLWLAAGLSSPLGTSFQSTIIWLWAGVVVGGEAGAVAVAPPERTLSGGGAELAAQPA